MSRRMHINRGGGPNHLVVDNEEVIGIYPSLHAACRAVVERGGRAHLEWSRTVVGGQVRPKDFSAHFEDHYAGRIYLLASGFSQDCWHAFPNGHNLETNRHAGGSMIVNTKEEAVEFIERTFTLLMAGVEPKRAPNAYQKAKGV